MTREQRKAIRKKEAQHRYRSYSHLPIWDIIVLENERELNWRFRPKYIDARMDRAMRFLWKEGWPSLPAQAQPLEAH